MSELNWRKKAGENGSPKYIAYWHRTARPVVIVVSSISIFMNRGQRGAKLLACA